MRFQSIDIWKNCTYNGADKNFRPTMDTYILDNKESRPAVLICPGGGYAFTSEREAECIAIKFNSAGYHAFILYYSVIPNRHPQPIMDVTRAMCIIRDNASEWTVDPDKIAVIGFSAGGHLAASIGVHWNKEYLLSVEGMEYGKNKPNALILSYPVILSSENSHKGSIDNLLGPNPSKELLNEMSLDRHVSENTPTTFLWHTFTDDVVPVENSMCFANALAKNEISFELHIFPKGCHGLSLVNEEVCPTADIDPHAGSWIDLCRSWLKNVFDENNQ